MSGSELFKAGKLSEAVEAQLRDVRSHPADQGKRLFLFELLAFTGDLARARKQIDAIRYDDPELSAALAIYRALLDAEEARRRLFHDGLTPRFFADPPEHVQLRLEAISRLREGRHTEAAGLLERANAMAPTVRGKLNDQPFETLRDADDLLAFVLEVMAHGQYFWVPLEQVEAVVMNAPKAPRDLLWVATRLETKDSAAGNVFLPALYPGSHEQDNDALRLGRATDWRQVDGGPVRGVGLKMYLAGDRDINLLEWRTLETGTE